MSQLKSYNSRIVVEKSLISLVEFHLHLCKCINETETYVFLQTPQCRRTYTVLMPVIRSLRKHTKTNETATE